MQLSSSTLTCSASTARSSVAWGALESKDVASAASFPVCGISKVLPGLTAGGFSALSTPGVVSSLPHLDALCSRPATGTRERSLLASLVPEHATTNSPLPRFDHEKHLCGQSGLRDQRR